MKSGIVLLLFCVGLSAQDTKKGKNSESSLVEAGCYFNFNHYKKQQNPGFFAGYWYIYPTDETGTHLEIGGTFGYSKSLYDFNYGKDGQFYPVRSEEFILNLGTRLVKEYSWKSYKIEWVNELSFHNLFFSDKEIPEDEPVREEDNNTIYIDIHSTSVASLRIGEGIRFWKNNIGLGIQASYMPYRLWYKQTVPERFNSFSVELSLNYKF